MATRSTPTYPKGKYVMKKPRNRQKIILTIDQYIRSQVLLASVKQAKEAIVVTAILWGESKSPKNRVKLLEELQRRIGDYHKLGTFPKTKQEIE